MQAVMFVWKTQLVCGVPLGQMRAARTLWDSSSLTKTTVTWRMQDGEYAGVSIMSLESKKKNILCLYNA